MSEKKKPLSKLFQARVQEIEDIGLRIPQKPAEKDAEIDENAPKLQSDPAVLQLCIDRHNRKSEEIYRFLEWQREDFVARRRARREELENKLKPKSA